ncbi:MAG: hypothetical protein COV29_03790, partial [Candidatus Yanofskybacteria bacterium CG10_big_fil_rev_8_21_14_0_10_36_16]
DIASSSFGYKTICNLLPDNSNANLVAQVTFEKSNIATSPLYGFIEKRSTNRKPYKNYPLLDKEVQSLLSINNDKFGSKFILSEDENIKKKIAKAVSTNEFIALETKPLHNIFFADINWTEEQEQSKKTGLYIKTLELPPPGRFMFKLARNWPVVNKLNKVGFSRLASKGNEQVYSTGSAIGIIVTRGGNASDFVNAGRLMQKAWLTATSLGLSVQPVAGMLFLAQRVIEKEAEPLSEKNAELVKKSYNEIRELFNIKEGTISMLLRIGYGGEPTAKSLRKNPEIKFV